MQQKFLKKIKGAPACKLQEVKFYFTIFMIISSKPRTVPNIACKLLGKLNIFHGCQVDSLFCMLPGAPNW